MIGTEIPRPVRLNNPGDLKKSISNAWLGMSDVQPDPEFVAFMTPAYGFRALAKLLLTYYNVDGLRNLEQFVYRFAPPTENNSAAYLADASERTGLKPTDRVNIGSYKVMFGLCQAISIHEGGNGYWTRANIDDGLAMLGITP